MESVRHRDAKIFGSSPTIRFPELKALQKASAEDDEEKQEKILEKLEDKHHVELTHFYGDDFTDDDRVNDLAKKLDSVQVTKKETAFDVADKKISNKQKTLYFAKQAREELAKPNPDYQAVNYYRKQASYYSRLKPIYVLSSQVKKK